MIVNFLVGLVILSPINLDTLIAIMARTSMSSTATSLSPTLNDDISGLSSDTSRIVGMLS